MARWTIWRAAICAAALLPRALGDQTLVTTSFTNCESDDTIQLDTVDITYNNDAKTITFNLAGSSDHEQNITASLTVTAYGNTVYSKSFNPCESDNYVEELCPVPAGPFAASGSQDIPPQYANSIPSIAFQIPDIAAQATLKLKALEDERAVGCIQSDVTNGKTTNVPAVSYIVAGIAGAAFVATGASAVGAAVSGASSGAGGASAGTISPSFTEMVGVFQGFAVNGMMSVNHPPVYRSFAKNFGFSTGLFPWRSMQVSIDDFREATGGNLTQDSVQFLEKATLVFPDGSTVQPGGRTAANAKRALAGFLDLTRRQAESDVSANDTAPANATQSSFQDTVAGMEGYFKELSVPSANSFMTVLLVTAIIIGVIIVSLLLVKVVLEAWSLWGSSSFPPKLTGFRKHYWGSIARTITSLILLLYGIWALYSVYQFTHGDSWAAQTLAGVTLAIFTGVLAFFGWKIWTMVQKLKQVEGGVDGLYDDKQTWMKYSLFYESYRRDYWWMFVPIISYMFIKGAILASTDGNGLVQSILIMIVECMMLGLLIWSKPFERKSSNIINIAIQSVRVLSVVCIFLFVEELGLSESTQTVTGVALIVIQSGLTGVLALLIAWNAIIACMKMNPHRQRRKEMEKAQLDDSLTPLDARNTLLMGDRHKFEGTTFSMATVPDSKEKRLSRDSSPDQYFGGGGGRTTPEPANPYAGGLTVGHSHSQSRSFQQRPLTPAYDNVDEDRDTLISHAAPIDRQPTLPSVGGGHGHSNSGGSGGGGGGYVPYRS
ncbi:hypothetical protein SLS62_006054 [Diatrype stigma]|uniref:ML-like domain-containing protein n=1 Tax=Diatrype stigma TaxID=117547 RepID=A0AAN9YN61_9PEZI